MFVQQSINTGLQKYEVIDGFHSNFIFDVPAVFSSSGFRTIHDVISNKKKCLELQDLKKFIRRRYLRYLHSHCKTSL